MREKHWLSVLHVRESRHDDRGIFRAFVNESFLKVGYFIDDDVYFGTQVEADVKVYLVVSASCGVYSCALRPEFFNDCGFDVHVNIFEGVGVFESLFSIFLRILSSS